MDVMDVYCFLCSRLIWNIMGFNAILHVVVVYMEASVSTERTNGVGVYRK